MPAAPWELAIARPASIPRPLPAPPANAVRKAEPPRIDVHIARIDVRASQPPPAPASHRATEPARAAAQAPRGFGDLAAARRHLDRLVR